MKNLESPFITSFSQADNALKIYYGFQYHAEKTTLRQTANTRNVLYKTQILPPRFRIHIPFSQFQQCRSCQRICRFTDCLFQSFVWGTAVHRGHTIIRSCMLRGPPALQQIDRLGHSFARSFCLPATGDGEVPSGCRPPAATRRTREIPALAFNHPQAPAPDRNDSWL